jgi:two-component system, chemotaxis family, CheB/CheR fusion protein
MLFSRAYLFSPVDLRCRLFTPTPSAQNHRERLLRLAQSGRDEAPGSGEAGRLREAAFETDNLAQLVIDAAGAVLMANEPARRLFGVASRDIGRPLQDLEISFRPVELRSMIERATTHRQTVTTRDVQWTVPPGETRTFDVAVAPLGHQGATLGVKVIFTDVTRYRQLQEQLNLSRTELEAAYEELQSTNEELQTTNEELQSTVEELETTNEELQSTNEELETMNEELQSTNEELHATNDELQTRSAELNHANVEMEAILTSFRSAVVVVDREMKIRLWNEQARDLWGLQPSEARGQHLLNLDIGLPVQALKTVVRDAMQGSEPVVFTLASTNRRGRSFSCRVTCIALRDRHSGIRGAILTMEEQEAAPDGARAQEDASDDSAPASS